jgi:hypothetical protein
MPTSFRSSGQKPMPRVYGAPGSLEDGRLPDDLISSGFRFLDPIEEFRDFRPSGSQKPGQTEDFAFPDDQVKLVDVAGFVHLLHRGVG